MCADDLQELPPDLPVPDDDGAAAHLPGVELPPLALTATDGGTVRLDSLAGRAVVFAYPRTGRPDQEMPAGWDAIPGARGCTPQNCAIRDSHSRFTDLGVPVYGLSTQDPDHQREAAERLHLPYPLLSDADLSLTRALRLPTFSVEGMELLKRLTLFLADGHVEGVIYPVFPPDRSAERALAWLAAPP